ncbi:MAG: hypothetical protein KKF08_18985 [Gammaproteobacteria bacterium]|nr:hypothetical protein [Gammaproteobacteria bacterium]
MPYAESMMVSKPGVAGKGKRATAAGILSKGNAFAKGGGKKPFKPFFKKKAAGFLRKSGEK